MILSKRQDVVFTDFGDGRVYVCDKACRTAEIIKWSVFLGLLTILTLWLAVGYWHVRRRLRAGKKPLFYHRWLAPKQLVPQNNAAYYNSQQPPAGGYYMNGWQAPPPMYNAAGMPPAYMPPAGATKAAPEQNRASPPPSVPQNTPGGAPPQLPPITQ